MASARITSFREAAAAGSGVDLPDSAALHAWSVDDAGAFGTRPGPSSGSIGERGEGPAIVPGERLSQVRFYPGARLLAENLLRPDLPADEVAIVAHDETGTAGW